MSYENQLDARIKQFRARKEREHPELRGSVDQLFQELISPHFSSQLKSDDNPKLEGRRGRSFKSRMSGLHYAV